jgi:hypothetical protein
MSFKLFANITALLSQIWFKLRSIERRDEVLFWRKEKHRSDIWTLWRSLPRRFKISKCLLVIRPSEIYLIVLEEILHWERLRCFSFDLFRKSLKILLNYWKYLSFVKVSWYTICRDRSFWSSINLHILFSTLNFKASSRFFTVLNDNALPAKFRFWRVLLHWSSLGTYSTFLSLKLLLERFN